MRKRLEHRLSPISRGRWATPVRYAGAILALAGCLMAGPVGCESKSKALIKEGDQIRKIDGDLYAALAKYTEAAEADPQNAKAYEKMASIAKAHGEYDVALKHYSKAMEIDPDQVELYKKIVGAHINRWDEDKVEGELDKAIEIGEKALKDRLVLRDPELTEGIKALVATAKEMLEAKE